MEYGFFSSPNYVKRALSFPRIQTRLTVSQFLCRLVTFSVISLIRVLRQTDQLNHAWTAVNLQYTQIYTNKAPISWLYALVSISRVHVSSYCYNCTVFPAFSVTWLSGFFAMFWSFWLIYFKSHINLQATFQKCCPVLKCILPFLQSIRSHSMFQDLELAEVHLTRSVWK